MDQLKFEPKRRQKKKESAAADDGPKRGRGQPSTYRPEYVQMAEAHCKLGATDADLADLFGVSTQTIWNWSNRFPDFHAALREGKFAWDSRVERSLASRALGYTVDTEEVKVLSTGEIVRYPVRKHYPPDTTACIFWLKNRKPKDWRDVQDHRLSGNVTLENLTAEQLLEEIRKEARELGILPDHLPKVAGLLPPKKDGVAH